MQVRGEPTSGGRCYSLPLHLWTKGVGLDSAAGTARLSFGVGANAEKPILRAD
jgi:hypothetical protein